MSLFWRRGFPAEIILLCVRWYCKHALGYRDLAETMQKRGVEVGPSTILRRVQRYAREIENRICRYQGSHSGSWRVDEAYVQVAGRDFGKDLIPYLVEHGKAVAHRFPHSCVRSRGEAEAYWRDVGTLDAYWAANIDLTHARPALDLYDTAWPIWTHAEITPPAKVIEEETGRRGEVVNSVLSGGCIIAGAAVRGSLLFTGTCVHPDAQLEEAVVLPGVEVARSARLRKVIVDRGVRVPEGFVVGEDPDWDGQRFRRTESGVCLITQPMLDKLAEGGQRGSDL